MSYRMKHETHCSFCQSKRHSTFDHQFCWACGHSISFHVHRETVEDNNNFYDDACSHSGCKCYEFVTIAP